MTGTAEARADTSLRDAIARIWFDERGRAGPPPGFGEERLFEFSIDACLATKTTGHGDYEPRHAVWTAAS